MNFEKWRWYHIAAVILLADAAISVLLWKNDMLGANRLIAPLLVVVGWFIFVQSRSDRYNQNSQCARCGCSVLDKDTVRIKSFKPYDPVYMYCQRCGSIAAVERGLLVLGGPFAMVAVFLDITAWSDPEMRFFFIATSVVLWIFAALFVRKVASMETQHGKAIEPPWSAVFVGLAVISIVTGLLIVLPTFL